MAPDAEFLYDSCTCESGMRDGQRCADCGGRGILPKGVKPTGKAVAETALVDDDGELDGLDDMSINHLRSRAKDLGISSGGNTATLVKAIREATADAADADGAADAEEEEDASAG
jgi:hypothetical protein